MLNLLKMKYYLVALVSLISLGSKAQEEIIRFESANPYTFNDVMTDLEDQETQEVFGVLRFPEVASGEKLPVVLGVAGSLGWREHHLDYLEQYREQGMATFELKSFQSRGITSTVGSQSEVTMAAMVLDAYRALEALSRHPRVDANRIAITGWSLGGGVTLFSAWIPLKEAINKELSFAAHLALYPPCFVTPTNLSFSKAPMHILIGAADNWTPAAPCEELVKLLENTNDIGVTVYENAHHGYDSEIPVQENEKGYSFTDCRFELNDEGDVLMNTLGIAMSNSFLQKLGFAFCAKKGVSIGGNKEARAASMSFANSFMKRHLIGDSSE
jgi:dienelactone hydrolase